MRVRAKWLFGLIVLAGALAPASPAQAGQFTVYACTWNGTVWDNRSWATEGGIPPGIGSDKECTMAGHRIDLRVNGDARTPNGAQATLAFRAPAGTTIADFRLDRQLIFQNQPVEGAHQYYALYLLGSTVFAGAGDFDEPTRSRLNAQRSWYGYPANNVDTDRGVVSRASFPALAGYKGDATTLALRIGCFNRGSPCGTGPNGHVSTRLLGAEVTIEDPTNPSELTIEASGLLAGGPRNGADPVRIVRAADSTGIRRAELIDVTDAAAPRVVGAEDYDTSTSGTRTEQGLGCSFRIVKPCPDLNGELITPTSLPAGRRLLAVRVSDSGGNQLQSTTYPIDVAVPSDRGAPNGTNAGEIGTVTASFSRKRALPRQSVGFGRRTTVVGRMVNEAGQPVANAEIRILTRDTDRESFVDRGSVTTDADGRFTYRPVAYASRLIQFAWKARVNDARYAANAYLTQRVRASASLRASRGTTGLFRRVTLRGVLRGRRLSNVDIVLEGRASGERKYRVFDRTETRKRGRFTTSVRFVQSASRGRTFRIRAKILPTGRFPYLRGVSRTVNVRVR